MRGMTKATMTATKGIPINNNGLFHQYLANRCGNLLKIAPVRFIA